MIRTLITPQTDTLNISLAIPKNYIGKEMEVIAFTRDEGIKHSPAVKKQVAFTVLHVENKTYKFDRDEANQR
jgi:hypothetical protein